MSIIFIIILKNSTFSLKVQQDELEKRGWIEINRPVHEPTGLEYDQQYWSVEVTPKGMEIVSRNCKS